MRLSEVTEAGTDHPHTRAVKPARWRRLHHRAVDSASLYKVSNGLSGESAMMLRRLSPYQPNPKRCPFSNRAFFHEELALVIILDDAFREAQA